MKIRLYQHMVVLMILVVLILSCEHSKNVARVNNSFIRMKTFKDYLESEKVDVSLLKGEPAKMHLNDFIEKYLIIQSAYEDSLHMHASVVDESRNKEEQAVYMQVIENKVYNEMLPVSEIQRLYEEQSLEFGISHIFIPVRPQMTDEEVKEAKSKIEMVYNKLLSGAEFEEMAKIYSEDNKTAGKGGWLGFIGWGDRAYGEEFYKKLNKMHKGQFSNVLRTPQGFHIVLLRTTRKKEQKPFDEQLSNIRIRYLRRHRTQMQNVYSDFINRLKKKYDLTLYQDTIDSMVVWFDTDDYNFQINQDFQRFVNSLTSKQRSMLFYTFSSDTVTVGMFLEKVMQNVRPGSRPTFTNREIWERYASFAYGKPLCLEYGYDHQYDQKKEIKESIKEFERERLYELQKQRKVDNEINISETDYRAYYEKNKERFEKTPRVLVQEIFVKDIGTAKWLHHRIKEGENFGELAERYTERDSVREKQGIIGYANPFIHREMGRKALTMMQGEISDPIQSLRGYSVIKILDREPGEPQTYDQVRGKVRQALNSKKKNELYKSWINELRSDNRITIFDSVLQKEFGSVTE